MNRKWWVDELEGNRNVMRLVVYVYFFVGKESVKRC